jgi:hypothetical protein
MGVFLLEENMYYYFAFTNADSLRTSFKENEISLEEMRKQFIGTWVRTGDEEYDCDRVADIWTTAQTNAYYND